MLLYLQLVLSISLRDVLIWFAVYMTYAIDVYRELEHE